MEQPCCFATIGYPDDRVNVTAMLSILIIPDRATKSDEGPRLEESHPGSQYCFTPSVWKRPRRTGGRVRVRLGRVIEIRHPLPSVTHAHHSDPASLQDCDQFLKVLLRRKADSLGRRERAEIGRLHGRNPWVHGVMDSLSSGA